MKKLSIMVVTIAYSLLSFNTLAQEQLSLEDVKKMVIERNEKALIADAAIKISEEVIKERKTDFLPSFSSSITGSAFTDNPFLSSIPQYGGIADVSIDQPIYTGGRLRALNELAVIDHKIAKDKKKLSNEELILQVKQLYWQVVSINQQVLVSENYRSALFELEEKISNFYEAGLVNKTELLETQVASNKATYYLEVAQNSQKIAKRQLAQVIDRVDTDFVVLDDFPSVAATPFLSSDIITAFQQRPELSITQNALLAKDEEYSLIKSEFRPQVGLAAGGYYYRGGGNNIPLQSDVLPPPFENSQFFGATFLSVSIPIYNWGQKQNKLKVNRLEASQLNWQRKQTEKRISLELENAIYDMQESNINIALTEKSKEQAAENVRITNDNYDNGLITSEEVLEAEALNQQAQLDYIQAKVQHQLSYSSYQKALGQLSN